MWDYFVVDVNQDVFTGDARISARPMTLHVESPFEIVSQLFDTITQRKGLFAPHILNLSIN